MLQKESLKQPESNIALVRDKLFEISSRTKFEINDSMCTIENYLNTGIYDEMFDLTVDELDINEVNVIDFSQMFLSKDISVKAFRTFIEAIILVYSFTDFRNESIKFDIYDILEFMEQEGISKSEQDYISTKVYYLLGVFTDLTVDLSGNSLFFGWVDNNGLAIVIDIDELWN